MTQNRLYLIICVLVAAVIVLGIYVYRDANKPEGVEIRLDESGVSIKKN